ncbi:MAG: hypothetical protein GY810_06345 [Aureispira sp.]|nr:hypothetical protein [Aureispira sp.]
MNKLLLSIGFLIIGAFQLSAQAKITLEANAKEVRPNVYALIFDIDIPQGWMMGAVPYDLIHKGELDTFTFSITLDKSSGLELLGRLKASYAPDAGYKSCGYAKKVTFVQLIRVKRDLEENALYIGGMLKYGMSRPSAAGPHLDMLKDAKFFRLRLAKDIGLPRITVGHNCLTKDIPVQ